AAEVARRRRQTLGPMAARDMSGVAAGNAEVERLRAEKAARTLVSATDAAGAAFESAADKIVRGRDMIAKAAADLEKQKALSPAGRATMPTAAAIDRRRRIGERYQAEAAETLARLNQSVEGRAVIYSAAQSAAPMASSPAGGARAASELQGLENLKAVVEGPITAELTGQASISTSIVVSPSPDFLAKIDQRVRNAIPHVAVGGSAGPGSTGKTMADVEP
ncbi:MAG TPA: hypothetical protein PLG99_11615, partial [Kaistiaceae bacterium]|nr:hypothetical protein [Kaistiaceae bacterium]